eukprot:156466-Rhodomonas_salina.1
MFDVGGEGGVKLDGQREVTARENDGGMRSGRKREMVGGRGRWWEKEGGMAEGREQSGSRRGRRGGGRGRGARCVRHHCAESQRLGIRPGEDGKEDRGMEEGEGEVVTRTRSRGSGAGEEVEEEEEEEEEGRHWQGRGLTSRARAPGFQVDLAAPEAKSQPCIASQARMHRRRPGCCRAALTKATAAASPPSGATSTPYHAPPSRCYHLPLHVIVSHAQRAPPPL